MTYTLQERVEIISLFFINNDYARAAALTYNAHLSHPYVLQLVAKFRETGSVLNKKRTLENPVRNKALEVSRRTIQRTLKTHKFHPYKIKLVHELNEDDDDRRLQFREIISEMIIRNPQFIFNICFSDEFAGIGRIPTLEFLEKCIPNIPKNKLNVWAGIFGDRIIGPYFIPGNLTGEMYLCWKPLLTLL